MVELVGPEKGLVDGYCCRLRQQFGNKVEEILLFGSHARGEANPQSDIDLLIVLKSQERHVKKEVIDLAWEVMFDYGFKAFLSPIVFFKKDYDRYRRCNSSFLENVSQDALSL